MRKIGLILGAVLVSVNCYAGSTDIKSAIIENSTKQTHSDSKMIYGGQDISRPVVATANESIWAGQPDLIG
jgi:hypothetical protein